MDTELLFRLALAALVIGLLAIRLYFRWMARKVEGRVTRFEGWPNMIFRFAIGAIGLTALLVQLVYPDALAWARLDLPAWARWVGVVVGAGGLALLAWTQAVLGENFSTTLHIREQHTLVMTGPYHWVRHPMYTSLYLIATAFFLLSANWLIGLGWLAGLTLVMITRVAREEAVMREKFGEAYQAYMRQTGRFLPRLGA